MWSVCGVLLFYSLSVTYISIFVLVRMKTLVDLPKSPVLYIFGKQFVNISTILLSFYVLYSSGEAEERQGWYKRVCQHKTWTAQEVIQSLTTANRNYKDISQLLKLWMFCETFQCKSQDYSLCVQKTESGSWSSQCMKHAKKKTSNSKRSITWTCSKT